MAAAAPHVSVQPDRVTFTVQHEIEISYADPPRAAASESKWLNTFTKIIESRELRGWGHPEVPAPQIQALYHSSALPVPIGNAGMEQQSVTNGLVSACLFAFAKHKRLVLRPDDIFLPLLDAAATHVFQNGEASRNVFVSHDGQKTLLVIRDGFAPPGSAPNVNDWAGTLPEFRAQLLASVRAGSVNAALPEFSTTDTITSAAFTCTLMRALQNFFKYEVRTRCGIPEVTLLGTVADWTDIRARFLELAATWMHIAPETNSWAKDVDDLLKQFVAARSGSVDVKWWTSLFTYNGSRGSGRGPSVTGHINALFPWGSPAKEYGGEARPQPKEFCWVGTEAQKFSFPDGMSTTPLMWNFLGEAIPMQVWSGSTCACGSEDGSEVAPAVCVGFTINSPSPAP